MAKKKQTRGPVKSPAVPAGPQPQTAAKNILLDWRFNLIVLGFMELVIVGFFLPREIMRYHQKVGQKALLREDYALAYKHYRWLHRKNENNPTYLKALGDVALGRALREYNRRQYSRALDYYERATKQSPNLRGVKIQAALAFQGLAREEKDSQKRAELIRRSWEFMQLAFREERGSLKVNYWMGEFTRVLVGDLFLATRYYSRVRIDATRRGKLNKEQQRLLQDAQTRLAQLQVGVFQGKDYSLDLTGMEITVLPPDLIGRTVPPPAPATTTPSATTTTAPAAATSPSEPRTTTAPTTPSR